MVRAAARECAMAESRSGGMLMTPFGLVVVVVVAVAEFCALAAAAAFRKFLRLFFVFKSDSMASKSIFAPCIPVTVGLISAAPSVFWTVKP